MRVVKDADELRAAVGTQLGVSEWMTVDQSRIDTFADATDDHQWIHVDPERAGAGPFGVTIAHGFLSLSLLPALMKTTFAVENTTMGVNYGLNRVRFTSPVPVGSRVRGNVELADVADVKDGLQLTYKVTVEIEGAERPALVAEWLTRQYVEPADA